MDRSVRIVKKKSLSQFIRQLEQDQSPPALTWDRGETQGIRIEPMLIELDEPVPEMVFLPNEPNSVPEPALPEEPRREIPPRNTGAATRRSAPTVKRVTCHRPVFSIKSDAQLGRLPGMAVSPAAESVSFTILDPSG